MPRRGEQRERERGRSQAGAQPVGVARLNLHMGFLAFFYSYFNTLAEAI